MDFFAAGLLRFCTIIFRDDNEIDYLLALRIYVGAAATMMRVALARRSAASGSVLRMYIGWSGCGRTVV